MNTKSLVKRLSDRRKIIEKLKPFIGGVKIDPYEGPIPFIVKDRFESSNFVSKPAYLTYPEKNGHFMGLAYGTYTEIINELIRRDSDLFKLEDLELDYLLKFNYLTGVSITIPIRAYSTKENNLIKGNPRLAKKYRYTTIKEIIRDKSCRILGPIMKIPVITLNPNYILDTDLSYYSNLVTSLVPRFALHGNKEVERKVWDYCRNEALYTIIRIVCGRDTKLLDLCLSNIDEAASLLAEKLCVGSLEPTKRVLVWHGKLDSTTIFDKDIIIGAITISYNKEKAYSILKELENMPIEDPSIYKK